jgi:amidase
MTRPTRTRSLLLVAVATSVAVAGLVAPASAGRPSPATSAVRADLDAATIPDIQREMRRGHLDSAALTRAYLQRIDDLDDGLNAVLEVNPRAMGEARASDRHRASYGARSALEGVPVLLKDNIDTRVQGATAGSRALLGSRPDDAAIVRRLQAAGAVVIGKANLSEWANFRSEMSSSGWSAVGGLTGNAYVLDRNPCGSSSGSGAGVAASFAQVAIGTETNGSIVCPAAANGVVGVKPTLGLVSRDGIVPISAEQDTAGPMARHTVDAAIALSVLQGRDRADRATREIPADQTRVYQRELDAGSLDGARIGVWLRGSSGSPETDAVTEQAVAAVEAAGGTVVDVSLPYQDVVGADGYAALKSEFVRDLEKYLQATPGRHPRTLEDLIAFNEQDPVELEYFGQNIFELSLAAPPAGSPEHLAARERATTAARASIDETLAAHDLDALMAPTNSPAWVTTLGEGDAFVFGSSGPAAVAGYPNVTVPAGYAGELPVGVSFFGERWSDAELLSYAHAFEQQTQVRRAPQLLPTLDD